MRAATLSPPKNPIPKPDTSHTKELENKVRNWSSPHPKIPHPPRLQRLIINFAFANNCAPAQLFANTISPPPSPTPPTKVLCFAF